MINPITNCKLPDKVVLSILDNAANNFLLLTGLTRDHVLSFVAAYTVGVSGMVTVSTNVSGIRMWWSTALGSKASLI